MGNDEGQHMHAGPADVPVMPVIPREELDSDHTGPRIIAPDRGKHFIGWQPRRDGKDDACFVIIFCTVFDVMKVIERFPLTEDGWRLSLAAVLSVAASVVDQLGKLAAMLESGLLTEPARSSTA